MENTLEYHRWMDSKNTHSKCYREFNATLNETKSISKQSYSELEAELAKTKITLEAKCEELRETEERLKEIETAVAEMAYDTFGELLDIVGLHIADKEGNIIRPL